MVLETNPPVFKNIDWRRTSSLNQKPIKEGLIIYWMSRDQRVQDNWSLLYASQLAKQQKSSLEVIFSLVPNFLEATRRQYDFMINGLIEVEKELQKLNIPFHLLLGDPEKTIINFINQNQVGAVITDFDPLHIKQKWQAAVSRNLDCAFYEVDAHNIVPCKIVSNKQEFGAYTIRLKIKRVLNEYLLPYPILKKQTIKKTPTVTDWESVKKSLKVNEEVKPVNWCQPGRLAAKKELNKFINFKLANYSAARNDPTKEVTSNLSPYLHFGQISAQRVALEIKKSKQKGEDIETFLEELIIRKELADNYCFYNKNYNNPDGFPEWAKKTIIEHAQDKKVYTYSLSKLEAGLTHDDLWNAAQQEMTKTGKMPGYLRMYWAKKIFEWTKDVKEAMKFAIYLNDKYQLDGRDPNGYTGIAWSIGGVHDRAWFERPIFGKIRFMSYNGCKSKFDIKSYIKKI